MECDAIAADDQENTLLELLDRLLNAGVVVCGDLAVSVADIELLYLRLQLTLSSVETARRAGWFGGKGDRSNLPERPATNLRSAPGFAQIGPVPFSASASLEEQNV